MLTDPVGRKFFQKYAVQRRKGRAIQEAATKAAGKHKSAIDKACGGNTKRLMALSAWVLKNPVPEISYDKFAEDLRLQKERLEMYREHRKAISENPAKKD